ncbi:MAG: sulfurtransferase-like selenium metabolism protein YedF [Smithella sp.]
MANIKIVEARKLSCPQPVILAKQALDSNRQVKVVVDNEVALENVTRLGCKLGCDVKVEAKDGGVYEIQITHGDDFEETKEAFSSSCTQDAATESGPFVIVVSEDKMGRGNDELGTVLIKAFLSTIAGQAKKPDIMIFYNTGVKLTVQDSDVLEDLKKLESEGVRILICGTCLNYFNLKPAAGIISNMFDIVEIMSSARRLITP